MKALENPKAKMAEKTDANLTNMLLHPDNWTSEALDAARTELQRRGIETR